MNFGGRTAIHAESLADMGYTVIWDGEARTLSITRPADLFSIETELGRVTSQTAFAEQGAVCFLWRGLALEDDGGNMHIIEMPSGSVMGTMQGGAVYVRLSDVSELLGAELSLKNGAAELTLTEATPPYRYKAYTDEALNNPDVSTPPGVLLSTDLPLRVNGADWPILRMTSHGREEPDKVMVYGNELFIPAHTAAGLLGFVTGR